MKLSKVIGKNFLKKNFLKLFCPFTTFFNTNIRVNIRYNTFLCVNTYIFYIIYIYIFILFKKLF